jgi:hypothetical protein
MSCPSVMESVPLPVAAKAQLLEHFPVVLDFILLPKDLPGKQQVLLYIKNCSPRATSVVDPGSGGSVGK